MTLTAAARAALYAETTDERLVTLIEVNNPDEADVSPWPFRFCDDNADFEHLSETYLAAPGMSIVRPSQTEQASSAQVKLDLPGVPDTIVREMRSLKGEPYASVTFVMASDPDTVIQEFLGLRLSEIEGDPIGIVATFRYEELHRSVYPKKRFTFAKYPGGYS